MSVFMISWKDIESEVSAPSMNHFITKFNGSKMFWLIGSALIEAELDEPHHTHILQASYSTNMVWNRIMMMMMMMRRGRVKTKLALLNIFGGGHCRLKSTIVYVSEKEICEQHKTQCGHQTPPLELWNLNPRGVNVLNPRLIYWHRLTWWTQTAH